MSPVLRMLLHIAPQHKCAAHVHTLLPRTDWAKKKKLTSGCLFAGVFAKHKGHTVAKDSLRMRVWDAQLCSCREDVLGNANREQ